MRRPGSKDPHRRQRKFVSLLTFKRHLKDRFLTLYILNLDRRFELSTAQPQIVCILAAIAALYVTMSVGWSVCRSDGLSAMSFKVSINAQIEYNT